MTVENVIADRAYSGKDNLRLSNQGSENGNKNFKLVSRLNPGIAEVNRKGNHGFVATKDADMMQIPHREGCYREGARSRTFSVPLKCDEHEQRQEFQETGEFKLLPKERYRIEAKNGELKNVPGYDVPVQ